MKTNIKNFWTVIVMLIVFVASIGFIVYTESNSKKNNYTEGLCGGVLTDPLGPMFGDYTIFISDTDTIISNSSHCGLSAPLSYYFSDTKPSAYRIERCTSDISYVRYQFIRETVKVKKDPIGIIDTDVTIKMHEIAMNAFVNTLKIHGYKLFQTEREKFRKLVCKNIFYEARKLNIIVTDVYFYKDI